MAQPSSSKPVDIEAKPSAYQEDQAVDSVPTRSVLGPRVTPTTPTSSDNPCVSTFEGTSRSKVSSGVPYQGGGEGDTTVYSSDAQKNIGVIPGSDNLSPGTMDKVKRGLSHKHSEDVVFVHRSHAQGSVMRGCYVSRRGGITMSVGKVHEAFSSHVMQHLLHSTASYARPYPAVNATPTRTRGIHLSILEIDRQLL
ncbi:hypothetical protein PHLGIDRAFT_16547 [Phlebiopsis gigantea 11061_1 CR5-6]|uniref:Uncharacterized protein n=1 Tax=Phlebiopsis gigantea (strain 11061_1 CR5-6) TaxID=745531 RepID=A0A0C3S0F2_PHLG1|nr:hypothetical protein PHLGIDRAFT_16547 [Phlebiopsis gigantea 11061_1 CR5-6]